MKDYLYLGIISILCIISLVFIVKSCNQDVGIDHPYTSPTIYIDTSKTIYRDSIVYRYLRAKKDTIILHDSVFFTSEVDTTINGDSLRVVYNFPPNDFFDIYLRHRLPDTVFADRVFTKSIIVERTIDFWGQVKALYGNARPGFGVGLGYRSVGLGVNQMFDPNEQIYEVSYHFNF